MSAATKISRLAVGDPHDHADRAHVSACPAGSRRMRTLEGLPLGTRGGILIHHTFPLDAEYEFEVGGGRRSASRGGPAAGADEPTSPLDGERIAVRDRAASRVKVTAGPHTIGAALRGPPRTRRRRAVFGLPHRSRSPRPVSQTVRSPVRSTPPARATRRAGAACSSAIRHADETACARQILDDARARAPTGGRVRCRSRHRDCCCGSISTGASATRFETRHPAGARARPRRPAVPLPLRSGAGGRRAPARRIASSDFELASRLSFFLWSSIPDDELLDGGARRHAARPGGARASRCGGCSPIRERRRSSTTSPASGSACGSSKNVQTPDRRTSTTTCGSRSGAKPSCSSQRSCAKTAASLDLLDADYTFVDERLARHYGIPEHPRQLLPPRSRSTGQPAARAARPGQHPDGDVGGERGPRRSSAASGFSKTCSGRRAPIPPPGVDTNLEKDPADGQGQRRCGSGSKRTAANPVCASCHKIMDPIGFALENFDLVGTWRDRDGGIAGRRVGPAGGRHAARRSGRPAPGAAQPGPTRSSRPPTERLLTYALGRPVRVLRHAGRAGHCRRRRRRTTTGSRRWSRHRRERAVSDEDEGRP